MREERKTRVLVVDDSALVRRALSGIIQAEPGLELVGTACDPFVAQEKINSLKPDVLTLDLEMPGMDGLTFLKKLMRFHPMPVIIISALGKASSRAAVEALQSGAVDVIAKPGSGSVGDLGRTLGTKIRAAASARLRRTPAALPPAVWPPQDKTPWAPIGPSSANVASSNVASASASSLNASFSNVASANVARVVAIGSSTGGVQAIETILTNLSGMCPPILIVQHIPPVFSAALAARLNKVCSITVREAREGDTVHPGLALIAPGNYHMTLQGANGRYRVSLNQDALVQHQRPAADVLFQSVAKAAGKAALGVILTGMGADGAAGLLAMKEAGARTIAQNEATCVVFGMPREAIKLGAAERVLALDRIAAELHN